MTIGKSEQTVKNTLITLSIPTQLWLGGYNFDAIGTLLAIAAFAVFTEGVWQRRVGR